MDECFKCLISGDKAILYDAISDKGIVKICQNCSYKEDIPILKKPTGFPITDLKTQKRESVYERMTRLSGVKKFEPGNKELKKQETSLRDIVDRTYKEKASETKSRTDLIDNFHWIIMRQRRRRKLTQEQLAKEISESEEAIRQAEQGMIFDDKLITKIERYLAIKIRKESAIGSEPSTTTPFEAEKESIITQIDEGNDLRFDPVTTKMLTIADLQEMKKKKETDIFENPKHSEDAPEFIEKPEVEVENIDEMKGEQEKQDKKEGDLSQEDIDDILFGRK